MLETVKPAVAKPELSEAVVAMGEQLLKDIKISDAGTGEAAKDSFEKIIPESLGITVKQVEKLHAFESTAFAALGYATEKAAVKFLAKHPKLNEVSIEMKVGKNTMGMVYTREREVKTNAPGNPAAHKIKYGILKGFYEARAAGPNHGEFRKMRDISSNNAEDRMREISSKNAAMSAAA